MESNPCVKVFHAAVKGPDARTPEVMNKDRPVFYAAKPDDCGASILKSRCPTGSRRHVSRHFDEDTLNRMKERATPQMMRIRRSAIEHSFAKIKRMMAAALTRSVKGTRAEMALSILAYNIMRPSAPGRYPRRRNTQCK